MKRNSVSLFFCRATAGGAIFSLLFAPAARAQFLPTSASTYDFNNVSNWLGSVLTGTATFSQTPVGPQTITFATAPLITPTFNFTIGGTNRSLSLLGTGSPVTLTLGGDITINSTGASVTIGDSNLSIALGGSNRTFSIASGNTLTLAGVVSGGNGFTVTNGGTLVVTAANTYTGTTTVSNGQLTLKNATGSATGTGNVTVGSGGTLQIGDATAAGSLGGNIANAGSVIFNRTDSFTYAGVISGAGLVNKYGTGTLTLTSDQNYTGATSVYAGTLAFGNGGASGGVASDIAVSSGATLAVSRSDTIGYTNIVSGAGNFVKDGTGKLILGAANTFS
ncbi:MAG: autotransporter-associated beta strand repeat-containing protein, partial [Undibacterium sp.]|nr:autotransporter-associated beta strand repeat-containing protein [Opitutaceae bacterium]